MAEQLGTRTLDTLYPDHQNPRIPLNRRDLADNELIVYLANKYNSLVIAKSIIKHKFFLSEPLIIIEEEGRSIVLEGNRRLAALKLLAHPELREGLEDIDEWNALDDEEFELPADIPVVITTDRRGVAPIIGYRHISGVEPWDAYAKSRYIAAQVGLSSFEETAIEVGETVGQVRAAYRNFKIAEQAEQAGFDTSGLVNNFGTFTRLMGSDAREFISVPQPREVSTDTAPVPAEKLPALNELLGFAFGENKVLHDSRDIGKLSEVLTSVDGVAELRSSRNLQSAYIASGGLVQKLINQLTNARTSLRLALEDIDTYREDADVKRLLGECEEALADLLKEENE
jgi:hypothetical protein